MAAPHSQAGSSSVWSNQHSVTFSDEDLDPLSFANSSPLPTPSNHYHQPPQSSLDPTLSLNLPLPSQSSRGPLHPGSLWVGTQRSIRACYVVCVRIIDVDLESSTLCGILSIRGLTKDQDKIQTFFEAEVLGQKYGFMTGKWGANVRSDISHWSRFSHFRALKPYVHLPHLTYNHLDRPFTFMRWKERFVVPDHKKNLEDASFDGFYYICVDWSRPRPSNQSRQQSRSRPATARSSYATRRPSYPPSASLRRPSWSSSGDSNLSSSNNNNNINNNNMLQNRRFSLPYVSYASVVRGDVPAATTTTTTTDAASNTATVSSSEARQNDTSFSQEHYSSPTFGVSHLVPHSPDSNNPTTHHHLTRSQSHDGLPATDDPDQTSKPESEWDRPYYSRSSTSTSSAVYERNSTAIADDDDYDGNDDDDEEEDFPLPRPSRLSTNTSNNNSSGNTGRRRSSTSYEARHAQFDRDRFTFKPGYEYKGPFQGATMSGFYFFPTSEPYQELNLTYAGDIANRNVDEPWDAILDHIVVNNPPSMASNDSPSSSSPSSSPSAAENVKTNETIDNSCKTARNASSGPVRSQPIRHVSATFQIA